MMSKLKTKRFILFTLLLLVVTAYALYSYAPKFIIEIKNPLIMTAKNRFYDTENDLLQADDKTYTIDIQSFDGLILKADIYKIQNPIANIIVLHGIRSGRKNMKELCHKLNRNGFNAIALDLRAHGDSQGDYTTFGYYEKRDISVLIDRLKSENLGGDFGIWGHSLGGAVALQSLATDKRLHFGIIESAYADFKEIVNNYSEYFLGFSSETLNGILLERAGEMADFPVDAVNPVDYARKINVPVLIAHGAEDEKINVDNANRIFKALPVNYKKLVIVQGAHHNDLHKPDGEKYYQQIFEFIRKSIKKKRIEH